MNEFSLLMITLGTVGCRMVHCVGKTVICIVWRWWNCLDCGMLCWHVVPVSLYSRSWQQSLICPLSAFAAPNACMVHHWLASWKVNWNAPWPKDNKQPQQQLNSLSQLQFNFYPILFPSIVNGYYSVWNRLLSLILFLYTNYTPSTKVSFNEKEKTCEIPRCVHFMLNVHNSLDQTRHIGYPFQHFSITVCDACHWMAITVHRMEPFALTSTQKPWQMKLSLSETVYVTKVDGKANGAPGGALLG